MKEILKCVIAGYGYMGEIRKRTVEKHPNLELLGVWDTDHGKKAKLTDTTFFETEKSFLDADADVVFVCTPNVYSPRLCVASMEQGKHVFCEKPPGRSLEDIKAIREAERPETKLMFGFNHRFHPGVIKAKVIVDSGRMGKPVALRGIYGKSGGMNFRTSWRNNKEISGGGILLDQGIHMLDLFRFFCGDFQDVRCFANNIFWNFDVEDNAMVILSNDNGQSAMLHSSATQWKHTFHITIILEGGYLVVEGLLSKSGSYGREKLIVARRQFEDEADAVGNPAEEVTYFDKDLSWDLEVQEFVRCITEDRPVSISNSQDALRVMEIIHAAYEDANVMDLTWGDDA